MKTVHKIAAVPAIALSALAFVAIAGTPSMAALSSSSRPDGYCLTYEKGASICEYATFAQCAATASGIGGQCDLNYFRVEHSTRYSPKIPQQ